ncbi:restriction endonuclease [Enterococcus avium]|jgi:hypothetical protein|uniref:Uncharacterized protein n=3 Tax=Enterococcus avium TaxID=33945 RepID=A0A4P8KCH5_ENTAV|nr:restriction endonuclease [Enterococcus avium]QCQ12301.1 hypothetical protein EH197_08880 [Enterococcus avium]TRZ32789.1 hypothetical protein AUF17_01295 [Enterococcus avium]
MLNYSSLNDVEFEELCKDIMERLLDVELRSYSRGRDGGVDLSDKPELRNIVVQVKHYSKSTFPTLKSSLKNEIEKVRISNPKQYYLCISKELTEGNILQIFEMFKDYMDSTKNIVTLREIESFLQQEKNQDIVNKPFKLWLQSSNILSEMFNRNLFIDCESLFATIEYEKDIYVQTEAFKKSLGFLERNRIIMLVGAPGVGKTITSKMILLKKVSEGYRARYTTNGDLSDIKRSLSADPDLKEIILLDDCLGQYYFNMKNSIESELVALIQYVQMHPNKLLILNSRLTILNEARIRSVDFDKINDQKVIKKYLINMDELSELDKARILYNHFYACKLPSEYFENIRLDYRYLKLIRHKNYTPRIIEYITRKSFYLEFNPNQYFSKIVEKLNFPDSIWEEEFEKRHDSLDRHFMFILFSLTDTFVENNLLKAAFESRISLINGIDTSAKNFENAIRRLNGSLITIVESNGEKLIAVINPSVNDYINQVFYSNLLELKEIRKSIVFFDQLFRCFPDQNELSREISKRIESKEILNLSFSNSREKSFIIGYYCCYAGFTEKTYQEHVHNFMIYPEVSNIDSKYVSPRLSTSFFIEILSSNEFYTFYDLDQVFSSPQLTKNFLKKFPLDELNTIMPFLWKKLHDKILLNLGNIKDYVKIFQEAAEDCTQDYVDDLQMLEIIDSMEIDEIINNNTDVYAEGEFEFDTNGIENDAHEKIKAYLYEMVLSNLSDLEFIDLQKIEMVIDDCDIVNVSGDDILNMHIDANDAGYDDDQWVIERAKMKSDTSYSMSKVDSIFHRPIRYI